MAEHADEVKAAESLLDKVPDKIHGHDSSSALPPSEAVRDRGIGGGYSASLKSKVNRLFGREKPVHHVFGGGKAADIFLWRDKKVSAGVLIALTIIWVFFELLECHLLTLVSHLLIIGIAMLFLWSNASTFINKSPPHIPQVQIPEKPVLQIASAITSEINRAFVIVREIASGKDLKQFLSAIAGLWVVSILGKYYNFLTLVYMGKETTHCTYQLWLPFSISFCACSYHGVDSFFTAVVLLFTLPVFYEKYDDQVDAVAEKALTEMKKQYAVFDAKVLSKIPRGQTKAKKF
ncbi:unnamed protein product [Malus baccata var. baccata]